MQSLEKLLGVSSLSTLQNNIVLVDHEDADASFLFHQLLSAHARHALSDNSRVVVVSFVQIFNHYASIARKLGVNLHAQMHSRSVAFIDALTVLSDATAPQSIELDAMTPNLWHFSLNSSLQEVLKTISQLVSGSKGGCIMIDGLSLLYTHLNVSLEELVSFVRELDQIALTTSSSLVISCRRDGSDDADRFIRHCIYLSDIVLETSGLVTGWSRDMDGQLTVSRGPRNLDANFQPRFVHYKVTEMSSSFFGKGLAI